MGVFISNFIRLYQSSNNTWIFHMFINCVILCEIFKFLQKSCKISWWEKRFWRSFFLVKIKSYNPTKSSILKFVNFLLPLDFKKLFKTIFEYTKILIEYSQTSKVQKNSTDSRLNTYFLVKVWTLIDLPKYYLILI